MLVRMDEQAALHRVVMDEQFLFIALLVINERKLAAK